MSFSIGTDIVYIPRIKKLIENESALRKMFHESELGTMSAEHLSGIIAAKESLIKAIGNIGFLDIAVKSNSRPEVIVSNKRIKKAEVSISHDGDYAIAFALVEL